MRTLLLILLAATSLPAEESLFGKKANAAAVTPEPPPAPSAPAANAGVPSPGATPSEETVDTSVTITPFRPFQTAEAKEVRPFSMARLNRPLAFESTRELLRLHAAFVQQHVADASPEGFARAPGPITSMEYVVQQDLGEGRLLVKANWSASADGLLGAGEDAYAVLIPEKAPAVGEKGRAVVANVGLVAVKFTPAFAPLSGRRMTMRREAFIECAPLPDGPAALQKFVDNVKAGARISVFTAEKFPCKTCGGLGFTREAQKGKLEDKRIPCASCESGKVTVRIETQFAP
ncbi:MAG: hypothetical protein ACO3ND_07340 [Opitutales bacterium]